MGASGKPLRPQGSEPHKASGATSAMAEYQRACPPLADTVAKVENRTTLPHPALGQYFTPSPTARRAQAGLEGENRFLGVSIVARFYSAATKVRGRFWVKRCGPSRRHARGASAVLENFVRQAKKTFSTLSALNGHGEMSDLSPLSGV